MTPHAHNIPSGSTEFPNPGHSRKPAVQPSFGVNSEELRTVSEILEVVEDILSQDCPTNLPALTAGPGGWACEGRVVAEHGQGELDGIEVMISKAKAFSSFPCLGLCKRKLQSAREPAWLQRPMHPAFQVTGSCRANLAVLITGS